MESFCRAITIIVMLWYGYSIGISALAAFFCAIIAFFIKEAVLGAECH